ncbi:hypothetical protein M422DRAFT_25744 [Sphaerobolus stellatus SS14]|nr:hypothetical protein M422DRAFT_25744 [Sphaerobolus stellatus SS14]
MPSAQEPTNHRIPSSPGLCERNGTILRIRNGDGVEDEVGLCMEVQRVKRLGSVDFDFALLLNANATWA